MLLLLLFAPCTLLLLLTRKFLPRHRYLSGEFKLSIYGSMRAYDYEAMAEVTEYVLLCQWGPDGRVDLSEYWLIASPYTEFKEMHKKLRKRLNPLIPSHEGAAYPSFPKKVRMSRAAALAAPSHRLLRVSVAWQRTAACADSPLPPAPVPLRVCGA